MANRQIHTNTFISGMNLDVDYSALRNDQYTYAENIRVVSNDDSTFSVLQGIEGFLKVNISDSIFNGQTIIHTNVIRNYGIVITEWVLAGETVNSIYRFDFSSLQDTPTVVQFINGIALDIVKPISSAMRWESDDNVKMYFADGVNQMRVVNVDPSHDSSNMTITPDDMNMIPSVVLPPLNFVGMGAGSLSTGTVQYAYQLFNPRGSETSISPLSKLIHIYTETNSDAEEATNLSVKLQISIPNSNLTRAYIYRIYYRSANEVPEIDLIGDIAVYNNTISYEDKGGTPLSELSIDEFNALVSYSFIPKVLETKDNILFAANTTESTWDIEYDARAYRSDTGGIVKLTSNSDADLMFNINDLSSNTVPEEYDCVSPHNGGDYTYSYNTLSSDGTVLGGSGLNISYQFVKTDLIEDADGLDSTTDYRLVESFNINWTQYNTNQLPLYNELGDQIDTISLTSKGNRYINYFDEDIDSKLKGYQRDEIYRFGIVFYNEASLPTPVHWIADIRMPHPVRNYARFRIWSSGRQVNLINQTTPELSVVTHPIGIRFTVNIPTELLNDIKSYEIVRCDRTLNDRTIVTQGVVSAVTNYTSASRPSNQLNPLPYMSYANDHGYWSRNSNNDYVFRMSDYQSSDYFTFVSPEICINKENSVELIEKFSSLERLYNLTSPIESTIGDTGTKKVLANALAIKVDGKEIISIFDSSDRNYSTMNGFLQSSSVNRILFGAVDYYAATIAKYYKIETDPLISRAQIESAKYATLTDTFDYEDQKWRTKGTSIGDKVYYNWAWIPNDSEGSNASVVTRKIGPHGYCAVFKSTGMFDNITPLYPLFDQYNVNGVILCNIRQNSTPYGGDSYSVRQNSVYIPTGTYSIATTSTNVNCFGGDTYIGILDYANNMLYFKSDDYDDGKNGRLFNGAYIPCESSINLALRSDKSYMPSTTYDSDSGYANHFVQNDIIQIGDLYSQSTPLYAYNDAYSVDMNVKVFSSKSIYNIDNLKTDYRIYNSQQKTNNEVTDSWTKFKVADYIDVDSQYGSINNMLTFNNRLYYWQSDAFGTTDVLERSLITDNNPGALTLGTSGILARYDYITTTNGSKPDQLRNNTTSDSTIYWYDEDRKELVGYNGNVSTLSKLKGVQSYLNTRANFNSDSTLVYDKKYNEVLINLDNKVLAFNEQLSAFTSFYTYTPEWWFEFSKQLYMFNDNMLYKYNSGDATDLLVGGDKISYIKFLVNPIYSQTKTFDNVQYSGDFSTGTNFDNIVFETKRQTSFTTTSDMIDYREDTYKFVIPRNNIQLTDSQQLINMSYEDRMKGKYLISNYYYNCNGGNTFKVPYINTVYRYSFI